MCDVTRGTLLRVKNSHALKRTLKATVCLSIFWCCVDFTRNGEALCCRWMLEYVQHGCKPVFVP